MASNPYAPRTRQGTEVTLPVARLRRLGATDAQIVEARGRFTDSTKAEQAEIVDALANLTDDELADQLMDDRYADYPDTLLGVPDGAGAVPPQAPDTPPQAAESGEPAEGGQPGHPAAGLVEGSIGEVLARVGDDPARAVLAIAAETAGQGRKTLLRQLRRIRG